MKLNVLERLMLLNTDLNPRNITTVKLIRKLNESLSFTEEEHKKLIFRNRYRCPNCDNAISSAIPVKCGNCDIYMEDIDKVEWSPEGDAEIGEKNIHMGEKVTSVIVTTLKKLNDEDDLVASYESLWDKFIGEEGEDNDPYVPSAEDVPSAKGEE